MISGGAQGADVFGRFFAEEAEDDMGAHATLSERTSKLLSILADLEALGGVDEATSRKLLAIGNATAGLLQRHAAKEDSLIFPMIERSLTPGQVEQVSARLEKIGSARDLTGESPEEGLSQLGG
jgi:hemerythrin-like domain-containing protein